TGIYKDINFNENELQQINIAAWMHDVGKITTPEYVVDKATKLETIYDRINTIVAKSEILKRDKEIELLKQKLKLDDKDAIANLEEEYEKAIIEIDENIKFIKKVNKGGEFMKDDDIQKINKLADINLMIENKENRLLSQNEIYNLSIRKGTLTDEEREIINNHVTVSYHMLTKLTFPKKLKKVPLIAGSHHKKIYTDDDGIHGGYGATEIMNKEMTLEDRILAVADVFEAVTANDRPYKDPNSLNQSLRILSFMVKDKELDRDVVKFFIDNKIYEKYSQDNLLPTQLDEVTIKID
ncbi:MAG: phosphohydrolase, partial [Arcobacteraceae bacterium]|nr:phosphohydrolase [Arcobacteraceae bacterium]